MSWLVDLPLLALVTLFTGYLMVVAGAACVARLRPRPTGQREKPGRQRFAVVIPAHNEADTLPRLLARLAELDYPKAGYEVVVVADNCEDDTAAVAAAGGARVLVRTDRSRRSKGYALGWAFAELLAERRHDAFVVLDADTHPALDFLRPLDRALRAGASVAQAYSAVGNAGESWRTALMAADMALIHYLRPAGRQALGGSADLQGSGICLTRAALREVPWETESVAEDREYHLRLLFDGIHAVFVPKSVIYTVMEPTMATARGQELRWEGGRFALARRYLPILIGKAWRRRGTGDSWPYVDAALDLTIPPFALLAAATALMAGLNGVAWLAGASAGPALAWGLLLAGQAFYVFAGCVLARVPLRAYAALFVYGPIYAAAKVWYVLLLLSGAPRSWVPTPRRATTAPERAA